MNIYENIHDPQPGPMGPRAYLDGALFLFLLSNASEVISVILPKANFIYSLHK